MIKIKNINIFKDLLNQINGKIMIYGNGVVKIIVGIWFNNWKNDWEILDYFYLKFLFKIIFFFNVISIYQI